MRRKITITLDEAVYEGLRRSVGKGQMSQFIEDLLRLHVLDMSLDVGDPAREAAAIRFIEMLDAPPTPNPGLERLMAVQAPWSD